MKKSSSHFAPGTAWPLRWFYRFLRGTIYYSVRLYFRRVNVIGAEHLQFDGPAIVVGNHPNTLLDPFLVGVHSYPLFYFLANAGLWKTLPGRLFFGGTYCIPVARRKDGGVPGVDNDNSFAAASAHLQRGGTLYIAPEGGSELERRIRPVKTGTARLILQTLRDTDFRLPLKLVSAGLTYSDPTKFQSEVWIHAAPVAYPQVAPEAYRERYRDLVKEITEKIQRQLEALTLVTRDDAEDALLRHLETLLRHRQPLAGPDTFYRSRDLLIGLQALSTTEYEQLRLDTDEYVDLLDQHRLSDRLYVDRYRPTALGFPLYVYGFINNVLAAAVVDTVAHGIVADDSYRSTARWFGGLLLLPLLYAGQIAVIQAAFGRWWVSLLYALSLLPGGLFAYRYHQRLTVLAERWQYRRLAPSVRQRLDQLRRSILSRIAPLIGPKAAGS